MWLFLGQLAAIASFGKGRKMQQLPHDDRGRDTYEKWLNVTPHLFVVALGLWEMLSTG
jgi:hypothetical protein